MAAPPVAPDETGRRSGSENWPSYRRDSNDVPLLFFYLVFSSDPSFRRESLELEQPYRLKHIEPPYRRDAVLIRNEEVSCFGPYTTLIY